MKKIIALMLCLLTVLTMFAACKEGDEEEEDKGPTIPVYITTEIANFDPAYSNLDDAAMKILGLIYEGLFKIDTNGKVVKAQAKSVKVLDDADDDYYAIEITLNNTSWSDGTRVQAADYIYAWKRILESEFRGEAANMLLGIKNARAVNTGDASIDDLGITDEAIDVIRIEFEGPTDYDKFYEYLASPLLVPLREIAVGKVEKDWASSSSIVVCNGPFVVRTYTPGEKLVIERNIYYYRDVEEDSVSKYVYPYRLAINFKKDAATNLADFEEGALTYISEFPLDKRAQYKDQAEIVDTMSILSCLFNTNVAPFDNADVRNALSLALDRNEIVKLLTFAKPAEGLIADGVFNTGYAKKNATSFRDAGESFVAASADVAKAKDLLKNAGVSSGDITITLRDNEADMAVAEYIKSVWTELGFKVTLDAKKFKKYQDAKEYDLVSDPYLEAYDAGDFQAILIDYQMLTTDAFPNLAMFAKAFACGKMNMDVADGDYELATHVSGYYNEAYDAKIEEAFAATDREARAKALHEAEKILMTDMPIVPLVQLQNAVVVGEDLKGLKDCFWGLDLFHHAELENREKY
jgi:oligopeptide transport system substrate-binding protein